MNEYVNVESLLGKVIKEINKSEDKLIFICDDNSIFKMHHEQDCCESVTIEDICGELNDLIGTPILMAEEVTSNDNPKDEYYESFTWTFYKFATVKGYVTIRWYGESNGYYSEGVDFIRIH